MGKTREPASDRRATAAWARLRKQPLIISKIAKRLDISKQAVSQWEKVPRHWVERVAQITGKSRGRLRPDLRFPNSTKHNDVKQSRLNLTGKQC
jgi:hypothetical protein